MHETPSMPERTAEGPAPDLTPERHPPLRPAVWVGSWLDYNDGELHGAWIYADQPDEDIEADIASMLTHSPTARQTGDQAEDWGVFDFDNFGALRLNEQDQVAWIGAVGRGIAEHGPAFAAYAAVVETVEALADFADDFLGSYDSVAAYAETFVDDAGLNQLLDRTLPDNIRRYVSLDTAAIAHDMQVGGDLCAVCNPAGGVWLFASR